MDLDAVARRLEQRLSQLSARFSKIQADLGQPGSQDSQERATESENEEVLERLGDADRAEIEAIRHALGRIRAGSYGVCSECGDEIGVRRLEVVPYTTVCVDCAR